MPASMQAPGGWTHPWYGTCRAASVGLPSSADAQSPSGASHLSGMTLQVHVDRHFPDLDLEQTTDKLFCGGIVAHISLILSNHLVSFCDGRAESLFSRSNRRSVASLMRLILLIFLLMRASVAASSLHPNLCMRHWQRPK